MKPGTKLKIELDNECIGRATVLSNGRVMVFSGKGIGEVMNIKAWYDIHQAVEEKPIPEISVTLAPEPEPVPVAEPKKTKLQQLLERIRNTLCCH
jgi:hypothetical protein